MMKIGIMQPYFLPYIGYFQLINAVDVFIVYDNIKYTKKGWINRNRMLQNGKDVMFSLPLKKNSDYLNVCERELAPDFNRGKLLNQFKGAYLNAPYFAKTFPLIEQIVRHNDTNLFRYLHHSIVKTCEYLGITTEIRISSDIAIDHGLKNQDKVLALCKAVGASAYLNPIGGVDLYDKGRFWGEGVNLHFLKTDELSYAQFDNAFIPWLSIIDVMMFKPEEAIAKMLTQYSLR
jgi:hypothetical protein